MTTIIRALLIASCVAAVSDRGAAQTARPAPAKSAATASIAGVVLTDEQTPRPLRKSRVTLNSVSRDQPGRTTTTDDEGRFVFADLAAGRFNLVASKPGFLDASYGAKRPERPGTPLSVSAGQRLDNVAIKIVRGGAITGTVRDQRGEPVPGAAVSALRYSFSYPTGERTLEQPSGGSYSATDDRGIYRAWGLPPGDYVLRVTPSVARTSPLPGLEDIRLLTPAEIQRATQLATPGRSVAAVVDPAVAPLSQATAGSTANYAPVFFPGTTDLAAATTLTLATAEERGGVDIPILLTPTARINVSLSLPEGVTMRSLSFTLRPTGVQADIVGRGFPAANAPRTDSDKTISFGGVAPGQYTVLAKTASVSGRGQSLPAGPATPIWWGMAEVTVDGREVNTSIDLQPGIVVSGRATLDGASPPTSLSAMRFFLVPPGSGGNLSAGPAGGEVDSEGRFTFTGVTPGRYRLARVGAIAAPWSVKSAVAGGQDLLDVPIDIRAGGSVTDLIVTLTDRPTQLTGVLQDASGRAAADYFIVVFPSDRVYWTPASRRVVQLRPANDGLYTITGLPAGDYRVAALTDVEASDLNDPAFLAALVDASVRVTLVDGQKTTQDLMLRSGSPATSRTPAPSSF